MCMNLKNGMFYYFMIITPLLLLVLFVKNGGISSGFFTNTILFYAIVYHPLISGVRLFQLGKISKSEILKSLIPFWNLKFAKDLFML
jgi:hypothetical protein